MTTRNSGLFVSITDALSIVFLYYWIFHGFIKNPLKDLKNTLISSFFVWNMFTDFDPFFNLRQGRSFIEKTPKLIKKVFFEFYFCLVVNLEKRKLWHGQRTSYTNYFE